MEWILLMVIGLAAGTLGSLVGLGGGIIIVPALIYFGTYTTFLPEISPQIAVGTSLVVIIFTGLSSTVTYVKYKTVDYKSGFIFLIGSGPAGIIGALINKFLDMQLFSIYFGMFMMFVSIVLIFKEKLKPIEKKRMTGIIRTYKNEDGIETTYGYHPVLGIIVAFIVGLFSGLFGIGGGSLMVPAMIILFLFPPHVAVATSMFMIFLSSIVSSIAHISMGNVDWLFALALIPGAWIGGRFGAKINTKLTSNTVVHLLRAILIIIGIRLIYQGIA